MIYQSHFWVFIQRNSKHEFKKIYAALSSLFTIVKILKQPKCPSIDKWIKNLWYIHTMEYYSAMKKNEILPLVTTCMDLEGIILREISQTEKDKYHVTSHMWSVKAETNS